MTAKTTISVERFPMFWWTPIFGFFDALPGRWCWQWFGWGLMVTIQGETK